MSMTHHYKLLSNLDGDNLAADFLSQTHCAAVACLWLVQLLNRMQTKRDRKEMCEKTSNRNAPGMITHVD